MNSLHAISRNIIKAMTVLFVLLPALYHSLPTAKTGLSCQPRHSSELNHVHNKKCVPVVTREITVRYREPSTFQTISSKKVHNHVKCKMRCVCDLDGGCHGRMWTGVVPCPAGGVWNRKFCLFVTRLDEI